MLLFLYSSVISAEIQQRTGSFPKEELKKQNREIARRIANSISETLPQKIDNYTELVSVVSKELTIIYTFLINTGAKSDEAVKKEDRSRMQRGVTKGICQSSNRLLQAGISTTYIYKSKKTNNELFKFLITPKDCIDI